LLHASGRRRTPPPSRESPFHASFRLPPFTVCACTASRLDFLRTCSSLSEWLRSTNLNFSAIYLLQLPCQFWIFAKCAVYGVFTGDSCAARSANLF
jgi:hypothetical protein